MFRQIIVFTKSSQLTSVQGLIGAAQTLGISLQTFNPFEETLWDHQSGLKLPKRLEAANSDQWQDTLVIVRTSGILFDDIDLLLAQELKKWGATLHLPLPALRLFRDKSAQAKWLWDNNFEIVPSLSLRGPLSEKLINDWSPHTKNFIVKSVRGNKGIGVKKFTREELLLFWEQTHKSYDQRYLIQPFIEDTTELRHLVIGDKHFLIQKNPSIDPNEFRKNSQFSEFTKYEGKNEEKEKLIGQAHLIQEKLNCDSFALDLLKVDGQWKILEMNANPGLTQVSEVLKDEVDLFKVYLESFKKSK